MKKKLLLFIILIIAVLAGSWFLFEQKLKPTENQTDSDLIPENEPGSGKETQQDQEPIEILVKKPETKQGEGDEVVVVIPNPAADFCRQQGYEYRTAVAEDGSQYGVCVFGETACPGWEYLQDKCQPGQHPVKYLNE